MRPASANSVSTAHVLSETGSKQHVESACQQTAVKLTQYTGSGSSIASQDEDYDGIATHDNEITSSCDNEQINKQNDMKINGFKVNSVDVVIDEILCYAIAKIGVVPRDELCKLMADFYHADDLATSVGTLYGKVQNLGRRKTKKGPDRAFAYARDIYDSLQNCMNKIWTIPTFVAANLHRMPAVDIDRVDAASLATQVSEIRRKVSGSNGSQICEGNCPAVCELKFVREQLRDLTNTVNQLCRNINGQTPPQRTFSQVVSSDLTLPKPWSGGVDHTEWRTLPKSVSNLQDNTVPEKEVKANGASMDGPNSNFSPVTRKKAKPQKYVIGSTKKHGAVKAAPRRPGKYTSIFVSRLHEETTAANLLDDLKVNGVETENLTCDKIKTKYPGYASYRIHGRCQDPDALLQPEMWDEGVFVKWYKVKKADNSLDASGAIAADAEKALSNG